MVSCASEKRPVTGNLDKNDQSKVVNLLDGKRASITEVSQGFEKGNIQLMEYANNSRDALLNYGEKYRYGVYILVTKKKEN